MLLYCDHQPLDVQSCITWRFPSTETELKGAITLLDEILSLALRDGEITIPKSEPRSEKTLLPTRPAKRPSKMETNSSPREQLEK